MGRKEKVRPIIYGTPVSIKRIGEYYKMNPDRVRLWLCRGEFDKYYVPRAYPRQYLWCKELELKLDKLFNSKGYYRCTDSKVLSRYSLEKESSYSI